MAPPIPITPLPSPWLSPGLPGSQETAPPEDPTEGLCPGPYGGPKWGDVSYERGGDPVESLGAQLAMAAYGEKGLGVRGWVLGLGIRDDPRQASRGSANLPGLEFGG